MGISPTIATIDVAVLVVLSFDGGFAVKRMAQQRQEGNWNQ